jgi:hypothetical protein
MDLGLIHLAQDRDQYKVLMYTVIQFEVMLRPTVSRPDRPGVGPLLGQMTRFQLL